MNAIGRAIRELWGLFVEDASFTIAIAIALLVVYFGSAPIGIPLRWRGPTMFLLLAIALVENVWRSARG